MSFNVIAALWLLLLALFFFYNWRPIEGTMCGFVAYLLLRMQEAIDDPGRASRRNKDNEDEGLF